MNYAVVNADNVVVNVIVWDGTTGYNPGDGLTLVQSDVAGRGDLYLDGGFVNQSE